MASYNSEKFDSCLNTFREIYSEPSVDGFKGSVILPLDFSLEIDGISGIIPHSAFEIPENLLPKSYLVKNGNDKGKSRIAFILHTIDHNFNNNKWTTKLTGQTLNIRFDELTEAQKEAIKQQQESERKVEQIKKEIDNNKNFIPTAGCTRQANSLLSQSSVIFNIGLIKNAAKEFGITGQSAIAAMCAIAGGECGLIPKSEGHIYKEANLRGVFPNLTNDQVKRATRKGITKKEFFSIVYGEYAPNRVGNRNVTDGGLYYGRGFNQLTGYGNYTQISNKLVKKFGNRYNILTNPDLMNNPEISAKALVAFYVDKMIGIDQNSTQWFTTALVKTGNDANGGYAKKKEYYNCLMSDLKILIT
jgi:predicted chitinase